ncbi:MAG: endonuclease III [Longimicrobiaceae bacterium]
MAKESKAKKKKRMEEVIARLKGEYPDSRCSLDHRSPLQLLVATILSAQCTDALVNKVTPELFRRYQEPSDYAAATQAEMEEQLRSVNFYRGKARSLIGVGRALEKEHGGRVPASVEQLTALPGVGRKTANVVLGTAFGVADGVVVDTHVKRITNRLAFTRNSDPDKVENDLLPLVPEDERVSFTHRMIDHGRAVCIGRKPRCGQCVLLELCPTGRQNLAA